jgi:hypothetical protein
MGLLLQWKRPHFVAIGCWRKLFLHHLFDEFLYNKGLIPPEGIMLPSPCECVALHSQKNHSADLQLMTESLSLQFYCTWVELIVEQLTLHKYYWDAKIESCRCSLTISFRRPAFSISFLTKVHKLAMSYSF